VPAPQLEHAVAPAAEYLPRTQVGQVAARLQTLDQVRTYCNDHLVGVSVTYACTVQTFDENFVKSSHKFSVKDALAVGAD
jgi:hypothetical protein